MRFPGRHPRATSLWMLHPARRPNCGTTAMWSYAPTLVRLPLPTFQ